MSFINFNTKNKVNIWPGVNGSLSHSDNMTFAHFTIDEGTEIAEHNHPHEQWTHVIEGKLEFNNGGEIQVLESGMSAYIPSDQPHSAKALTEVKVIDCFTPVREDLVELEQEQSKISNR